MEVRKALAKFRKASLPYTTKMVAPFVDPEGTQPMGSKK